MKLRNRFLLVVLGMVVFIITTPVIVLYALGYKFDLQTRQITKTGSLVVKSEPDDSLVYVNDVLQPDKTDSTLRFLLPGDYNFKVDQDGYQSWTKRLNLRSGIVTWANQNREFISLFYDAPKIIETKSLSLAAISVEENSAIIVDNNGVSKYNPNRRNFENISQEVTNVNPPTQLPNTKSTYYFTKDTAGKLFTPEQLANSHQLESNGQLALLLVNNDLLLSKNGAITVFAKNVSGFHLENEHLWYVEANTLKHATLNLGLIEQMATLPYSPIKSQVIRGNSQMFLVLDQTAYALNDKLEEVYRGVTYAYWNSEMNRLVLANNNEALLFDPGSFRSELIIRSSSPIEQPVINQYTGYLFFMNEGKIKAIELDRRDHRNVYTISTEPTKSYLVSDNGKYLTTFTETELKIQEIR